MFAQKEENNGRLGANEMMGDRGVRDITWLIVNGDRGYAISRV